ncbi:MAG: hypothetical protein AAF927_26645 [Bacteroidota bacterium]
MVELDDFSDLLRDKEERIRYLLKREKKRIHYPGKYNNPQFFFPEDVAAFHRLENDAFPLETTGLSLQVRIFHEYYEMRRYPKVKIFKEDNFYWRDEALEDAKRPQYDFIYRSLSFRLNRYRENFKTCLESARAHDLFRYIKDDVQLIRALIAYYKQIIEKKDALKIFFKDHIVLTRPISKLFCEALIVILEEKIFYTHPESVQIADLKKKAETPAPEPEPTEENEKKVSLHFPKPETFQSNLSLNALLQLMYYAEGTGLIRNRIPKRHLAYALHLLTSYSWKHMEKNAIKSRMEKYEDIIKADTISFHDKNEYRNLLNEISSCLGQLSEQVEMDIERLNSIKTA